MTLQKKQTDMIIYSKTNSVKSKRGKNKKLHEIVD